MTGIIPPRPDMDETVELNGVLFRLEDILNVVDDFYTRVQHDDVLSVPFSSVTNWPEHIQKLTHFWWVRFGGKAYFSIQYNPIAKHFVAGFTRDFLKRWLNLFHETLSVHLNCEQSEMWKEISELMGESLAQRNEMLKAKHGGSKP